MSKILLIEDNGSLSNALEEKLSDLGYLVDIAYSHISALDCWEENNGQYDCIILDLQINPDGLTVLEISKYTPLFGLAFLNYICNNNPEISKKIIIFSGFIDALKHYIRYNNSSPVNNITKISKQSTQSIREVINEVKKVIHNSK